MTTLPSQPLTRNAGLPEVGQSIQDDVARVEVFARAQLPTRSGDFEILVFRNDQDDREHVALVRGEVHGHLDVPVRVHSECLTGDVLGSLRCDCREQLEMALDSIGSGERGALIYMRQEGRGIGLGNKIRAYTLQEQGFDTFEANEHLGFDHDLRDYRLAALILRLLGIRSARLATNNPAKVFGLNAHGVDVSQRDPALSEPTEHNEDYLASKARSGHFIPFE